MKLHGKNTEQLAFEFPQTNVSPAVHQDISSTETLKTVNTLNEPAAQKLHPSKTPYVIKVKIEEEEEEEADT